MATIKRTKASLESLLVKAELKGIPEKELGFEFEFELESGVGVGVGLPVHTVDEAFIPARELRTRFRLDTAIAGEAYNIDIEDLLKCVRRCAERNEVFVLTSHGIAPDAKGINMKTEWLERILATAKECGVAVIGYVGHVEPAEVTDILPQFAVRKWKH